MLNTSLGKPSFFSTVPQGQSFSLSSEYESKQLAPLSTGCPAIYFKEKSWVNVKLCLKSEQNS